MSLTLHDANGGKNYIQDSVRDLSKLSAAKVVVHDGTWIFYKYKDFNAEPDNQEGWIKFLKPNEHRVDISDFNGSVYLLPQQPEGIILFGSYYYGGERKYYNWDCKDVTADFPAKQAEGVSSAIVLGGKFDVFTGKDGNGTSSTLGQGEYPTSMNIANDSVQSIQKLE